MAEPDKPTEDRRGSDHARRRPGGERDFYRRDEYSEDAYSATHGEEGLTRSPAPPDSVASSGGGTAPAERSAEVETGGGKAGAKP